MNWCVTVDCCYSGSDSNTAYVSNAKPAAGRTMCAAYVVFLLALLTTLSRGTIIVDRSERNLTTFPSNITISVEILLLPRNFIDRISATDLCIFVNVTKVNLTGNKIRILEDGCFDSNGKLAELSLDDNKIRHWPMSVGPLVNSLKVLTLSGSIMRDIANFDLRSLSSLNYLALGRHNFNEMGIDILQFLPKNAYELILNDCSYNRLPNFSAYIPNIKRISMAKNDIQHLSVDDFSELTKLKILEFERNNLQTTPDLYNLGSLRKLKLAGNPLVCNCTLCWIIMWNHVKTSKLKLDRAACHFPGDLDGIMISNIDPIDTVCHEGKCALHFVSGNYILLICKVIVIIYRHKIGHEIQIEDTMVLCYVDDIILVFHVCFVTLP